MAKPSDAKLTAQLDQYAEGWKLLGEHEQLCFDQNDVATVTQMSNPVWSGNRNRMNPPDLPADKRRGDNGPNQCRKSWLMIPSSAVRLVASRHTASLKNFRRQFHSPEPFARASSNGVALLGILRLGLASAD